MKSNFAFLQNTFSVLANFGGLTPIYERLEAACDDAGRSKTVAVE